MACGSNSKANFPSYLKSILKDIDNGNDNELKSCACSLKIPTTNAGCFISDRGINGAFPFCLINGTPEETGPNTYYPISFKLADLMKWYWTGDKYKIKINWSGTERGDCGRNAVETQTADFDFQESDFLAEKDKKKRVCAQSATNGTASFSGSTVYYWPCTDGYGGNCCCGGDCPDPYTVTFTSPVEVGIDFENTYIEDNGTVWPKFNYDGAFSNIKCGNPTPKVDNALSAGIRAKFDGKSLDPLYFCWAPAWGPDAAWGWTGSINITVEITYLK